MGGMTTPYTDYKSIKYYKFIAFGAKTLPTLKITFYLHFKGFLIDISILILFSGTITVIKY